MLDFATIAWRKVQSLMHVHMLRTLATLITLIALSFTLGACGNRTPLTLPKPTAKPPASAPATAPAQHETQ